MAATQFKTVSINATQGRVASRSRAAPRVVAALPSFKQVATTVGTAAASLALAISANAATVKLGADNGALVFEPATVTISKGDSVTWVNNAGFPHNIVFDEDAVPSGVNAEAISHEDYLNAPGEKHTAKFDAAGEYGYYCEPHQGAGMVGKVVVQ